MKCENCGSSCPFCKISRKLKKDIAAAKRILWMLLWPARMYVWCFYVAIKWYFDYIETQHVWNKFARGEYHEKKIPIRKKKPTKSRLEISEMIRRWDKSFTS